MRAKPLSLAVESPHMLQGLFEGYSGPNFAIRLWDDSYWSFSDREPPACTIVFKSPDALLDEAQWNKLELISRKLRLQPSEHFLDIGCGWGSLILHAALHHGAYAYGITLSQQQTTVAAQRISEANVTQSCRAECQDNRAFAPAVHYDKIARWRAGDDSRGNCCS